MKTFRHKKTQYQITSDILVDAMGEQFGWAKPINRMAWGNWVPVQRRQQKQGVWHLKLLPEGVIK